jgi:uncharacterized protein YndB with AHSA1/START domain
MPTYRLTTLVNAPRERVFELWIDLDRMPEWIGGLTKITDRTGSLDQKGARYTSWFGSMKSPTEVLDVERPRFIRTRFGNAVLRGESEATFEPESGGTRIVQVLRTQGVISAIAGWIFSRGSWKGSFKGELDHFRKIAERGQASEPA